MVYQITPYIYPLALAALLITWLSTLVWRKRSAPGAKQLLILLLAISQWMLTYSLELLGADLSTKHFWAQVEYFGIVSLPVAWLYFALNFTGQERKIQQHRWRFALFILPVLTLVMAWTPALQSLIWQSSTLDNSGLFLVMISQYGYGFWSFVVYTYTLFLIGSIILLRSVTRINRRYRNQIFAVLIAVLAPIVGNILYLFDLNPLPGLDLSPYGFAVSGLALTWAILKQNLMDLLPIARTTIVENLQSSVIVLDQLERIVDINPPACKIFSAKAQEFIGQPFSRITTVWPELGTALANNSADEMRKVIQWGGNSEQSWFKLHYSRLRDYTNQPIGQLITLLDISEEYQAKESLQKRLEELSTIHAITQAGVEAIDEDALIEAATRIIGESLFPDNFGFMLVDRNRGVLCFHSSYRGPIVELKTKCIPLGEGVTGKVATTGQPFCASDVATTVPEYIVFNPGIHAEVCVPLKVFGEVVGVINAESSKVGAFQPEDERLLVTFANQLATAIEKLRSQTIERQQASRLERSNALIEALTRVATRIESSHNPDQVLEVLGSELLTLGFSCVVALFEPNNKQMVFRHTSLPAAIVRYFERVGGQSMSAFHFSPEQMAQLNTSIEERQLMSLQDGIRILTHLLPGFAEGIVTRIVNRIPEAERALIVHLPLRAESGILGIFWLIGTDLQDADLPALSVFARQTAIALENARLYAAERKRSQELEAIRQASLSLTSSLELPVVLDTILAHAIQLLKADNASIFLYDGKQLSFGAARWADGLVREMPNPRENGVTYQVAHSGNPIIIPDINNDPFYQHWQWGGSMVSQPLLIGKQARGVMNLALDHPHQFIEDELRTLHLLADQAALALENARLFEEAQRLAITDDLTGLNTRRYFFNLAEAEFARSVRFDHSLTAIMLDADHFKHVNDTYGHAVGDEVLRAIAQRLLANLRSIDIIGRYGGEEFVILLPETGLAAALQVAERLRSSIANEPIRTNKISLKATISVGIAERSKRTLNLDVLVNQADEVLLKAKNDGRNQVVVGEDFDL